MRKITPKPILAKNISIFVDGTWMTPATSTNVSKLFSALKTDGRSGDVKFYYKGVGSTGLDLTNKFGGIFGLGLTDTIIDSYLKICMSYKAGAKINLFGYSRGAFTARSIAGLICRFGLVEKDQLLQLSPRKRKKLIKKILHAYRSDKIIPPNTPVCERLKHYRDIIKPSEFPSFNYNTIESGIYFIGVWDTVDAVGVPFDSIRAKIDKVWRKITGRRLWGFYDQVLSSKVAFAAQGLAIDENRGSYDANVWKDRERLNQRWFPGSHSDVGGEDGNNCSLRPLVWMANEIKQWGLKVDADAMKEWVGAMSNTSNLSDPRKKIRNLILPFRPREIKDNSVIDQSVFDRIKGISGYAPKNMPFKSTLQVAPKIDDNDTTLLSKIAPITDSRIIVNLNTYLPALRRKTSTFVLATLGFLGFVLIGNSYTNTAWELPQWLSVVSTALPDVTSLTKIFASWWTAIAFGAYFSVMFLRRKVISAESEYYNLVWNKSLNSNNPGYDIRMKALNNKIEKFKKYIPRQWVSGLLFVIAIITYTLT